MKYGHDLFALAIYINYKRADSYKGSYPADNVRVDPDDESVIHFDWTLSKNVTRVKGTLTFLVCAKDVDDAGNEGLHWNSELNKDMYITEGLEVDNQDVLDDYPDVVTQLLLRMDTTEKLVEDLDKTLVEAIELQEYFINGGDLTHLPDARGVEF